MPQSLLQQLSEMTIVVADTGDINAIRKFKPRDATTNPSLIMAAAQMSEYTSLVDDALAWAKKDAGSDGTKDAIVRRAIDRLSVEFGLRILEIVAGRVSTEVDARLSLDTQRDRSRRPAPSSSSTRPPGRRASACSSRSPPPGRGSAPPRCSSARGSTAT